MLKSNNPRLTWKYSNEFKVNAIQLNILIGFIIKPIAEKLDRHMLMLSRLRKNIVMKQILKAWFVKCLTEL
jgi:transposase